MTDTAVVSTVFDTAASVAPEIREGLVDRRHERGDSNPSGDRRRAADAWADSLFADRLTALDGIGSYASEERAAVVQCGDGLSVTVDPIDGSSNLVSNAPVGSILGVFDAELPATGRDVVAAGYVLYGPLTTITVARDGSVRRDVVGPEGRRLDEEDHRLPEDPTVYGFGGRRDGWLSPFEEYAEAVADELKLRYSGALVADVNQVLVHGGVFAYPRLETRPAGKLRHQFEAVPVAYVVESAGGSTTDGSRSLLETTVDDLHARTPVHVGSDQYVDRLEAVLSGEARE